MSAPVVLADQLTGMACCVCGWPFDQDGVDIGEEWHMQVTGGRVVAITCLPCMTVEQLDARGTSAYQLALSAAGLAHRVDVVGGADGPG